MMGFEREEVIVIEIDGVPCMLSIVKDISAAKAAEQRLADVRRSAAGKRRTLPRHIPVKYRCHQYQPFQRWRICGCQ
jgi:hypothetical protein